MVLKSKNTVNQQLLQLSIESTTGPVVGNGESAGIEKSCFCKSQGDKTLRALLEESRCGQLQCEDCDVQEKTLRKPVDVQIEYTSNISSTLVSSRNLSTKTPTGLTSALSEQCTNLGKGQSVKHGLKRKSRTLSSLPELDDNAKAVKAGRFKKGLCLRNDKVAGISTKINDEKEKERQDRKKWKQPNNSTFESHKFSTSRSERKSLILPPLFFQPKTANRDYKLSNGFRKYSTSMKKCLHRRSRIEYCRQRDGCFSWVNNEPVQGYIEHPDAKWLMHPSFFDDGEFSLCLYNERCVHERDCAQTRLNMAAMSYLRNRYTTTYRDLELVWGVSRSTIQRKVSEIEETKKADLQFILN